MTSHSSHTSGNGYTLTFSQLSANFLVDKELLGAQDPYVIFEQKGTHNRCQTKAIKGVGASTCEWKETYTLKEFGAKSAVKEATSKVTGSHSDSGTVLEVTAYNHNTLRPDGAIGSGTVDLARLSSSQLSGSGDRVTVHLTDKKNKNVGELKFLIHGGGYQGSSSSSGTGYGTAAGAGAVGAGAAGAGVGHSTSDRHGPITGEGYGTTEQVAHHAARKAATEQHDVEVRTREGVATGHPTGAGVGSQTGSQTRSGVHGEGHTHSHGQGHIASGVRAVDAAAGEVVDRKYYVSTEDRPQDQALVEQFREHNPYEKEYETTVQHTGRERLVDTSIEALGTRERVIDTHHHVHANPEEQIARALPAGAVATRPGGEGWVQGKPGPVCDSTRFAITGDVTVDRERVTDLKEHREFEKEFEVKTAVVGERALEDAARVEQLNRERILLDEKRKVACEGHPNVDAPNSGYASQGGLTSGQGTRGTQGSGLTSGQGTHGSGLSSGTQGVRQETTDKYGHNESSATSTTRTTGQGVGSTTGQGQQEKGMFAKMKDSLTGQ